MADKRNKGSYITSGQFRTGHYSKQPEVLPKILDKMDKVDSSLHDVVMKMRGVKNVNEEQDLTGYQ